MRKLYILLSLATIILTIVGCQKEDSSEVEKKQNEGNDMGNIDIFDFAFIKKAPETSEKQDLNRLIKVYFNENDSSLNYGYALDLKDLEMYINPMIGSRGLRTSIEEPIQVNDFDGLIEILEKHQVQNWDKDYTVENPDLYQDGYGWQLWLQFEDGTVEKHGGSGTNKEYITPENFHEFVQELKGFVEGKLDD